MSNVYTIGDCVLDIIFENNIPIESKPGGSFLNSSVTLGRLGVRVSLLSELGKDKVGETIAQFLVENNVNTNLITRFSDTNTNLALAFLDEERNADYSFYKTRKNHPTIIGFPENIGEGDIILFGSFLAIKSEFREKLVAFLTYCRRRGAVIIYDPNFRTQHLPLLDEVLPFIKENMSLAHLVKASNEDFELICGAKSGKESKKWMQDFSEAVLIYTANKFGVQLFLDKDYQFTVPQITPLSTVGAGDTFNAAIAYFCVKNKIGINEIEKGLPENKVNELVELAIQFSQEVCMSYDNFLPVEMASKYRL